MGTETWKVIPNYPKYQCSSRGRIKSEYSNRILNGTDNGLGYKRVYLRNDNGIKPMYVHRIVGMLFLDNPGNKPCINHIDNDPSNNSVENLEWCTKKENTEWMVKQNRNKRTEKWLNNLHKSQRKTYKPVMAINVISGNILEFENVNSVNSYGFQSSCVSNCCNGKRPTHAGYYWVFM